MSKSLQVWNEELDSKNKHTTRIYKAALDTFLAYTGWDHEELFNIHFKALKAEDPRDWHEVSRKVKACMKELVDKKGYSTSHAYQVQKAVTSFLNANGLTFKMNGSKPFSIEYLGQNVVGAADIGKLLYNTAEARTRALIMVAKDSGLRVSDIVKLNVGDVRPALEKGENFIIIDLKQKKGGRAAKPILGPEALQAVREWLDVRPNAYGDDSPLFTKIEGEGKYDERLSSDTASNVVLRLARKAGLKKVSIHSLRKFHTTFCTLGKIPETWVAIIQGRKIRDSRNDYMKPTDAMLIKVYTEAYPQLRVYKPEDEALKEARKEIDELKSQFKELDTRYKKDMEDITRERREFNLVELLVQAGADPEMVKELYPHLIKQVEEAYKAKLRREGKP